MDSVLLDMDFVKPVAGWDWPEVGDPRRVGSERGMLLDGRAGDPDGRPNSPGAVLNGPGVHTRNGDSVEWHFALPDGQRGKVAFGFASGFERIMLALDLDRQEASISSSDWSVPQPMSAVPLRLSDAGEHRLVIHKTEGSGHLVKMAGLEVRLDGEELLRSADLNLLPEMGVVARAQGGSTLLTRFIHHGEPSSIPEYLNVGGWQMLNQPDIKANLASLKRGLRLAAEAGVELLVTPETSLTGLFPRDPVTFDREGIAEAEAELRRYIRELPGAPHVVVGLPVWERVPGNEREETRYNVSRVYDPDGGILGTYAKVHSCEDEFWHGYRLHEFDVRGVPVTMHICHDGRYPELWTLPVMFGARLILHPSNGGLVRGSIDAFEAGAKRSTSTSHAFYVNVNGGGGSYIAGPAKFDNLFAVSRECRRDVDTFPMVGPPVECLLKAQLRIHDAYGSWPARSFRASEQVAEAYLSLYRALGGNRA